MPNRDCRYAQARIESTGILRYNCIHKDSTCTHDLIGMTRCTSFKARGRVARPTVSGGKYRFRGSKGRVVGDALLNGSHVDSLEIRDGMACIPIVIRDTKSIEAIRNLCNLALEIGVVQ